MARLGTYDTRWDAHQVVEIGDTPYLLEKQMEILYKGGDGGTMAVAPTGRTRMRPLLDAVENTAEIVEAEDLSS